MCHLCPWLDDRFDFVGWTWLSNHAWTSLTFLRVSVPAMNSRLPLRFYQMVRFTADQLHGQSRHGLLSL